MLAALVDTSGAVAPHVVIEPESATPPAGGRPVEKACQAAGRVRLLVILLRGSPVQNPRRTPQ